MSSSVEGRGGGRIILVILDVSKTFLILTSGGKLRGAGHAPLYPASMDVVPVAKA